MGRVGQNGCLVGWAPGSKPISPLSRYFRAALGRSLLGPFKAKAHSLSTSVRSPNPIYTYQCLASTMAELWPVRGIEGS